MSYVKLNNAGINAMFRNPRGPVAQRLHARADRIEAAARGNINKNMDSRTGDLLASLRKVPFQGVDGFFHIAVGADAVHRGFPYAKALETGINPLTGADMKFNFDYAYMVPAVTQAGFRRRT